VQEGSVPEPVRSIEIRPHNAPCDVPLLEGLVLKCSIGQHNVCTVSDRQSKVTDTFAFFPSNTQKQIQIQFCVSAVHLAALLFFLTPKCLSVLQHKTAFSASFTVNFKAFYLSLPQ
jgi:hypothetical protein